jgi:predicted metal-binding membrane protein
VNEYAPGRPPVAERATGAGRGDALLERVVRRDRIAALAGVLAVAALAWVHLLGMARHDAGMGAGMAGEMAGEMAGGMTADMAMPHLQGWDGADLVLLVVMWAVMMVAMMLPSAAPLVLLFAGIARRRRERRSPAAPTSALAAGYLLAWTAFRRRRRARPVGAPPGALLSPEMASASPILGGLLLIGAGVYQWTPLKGRCLSECRSPFGFLTREWREGVRGALVMGARHGAFCVAAAGCSWRCCSSSAS